MIRNMERKNNKFIKDVNKLIKDSEWQLLEILQDEEFNLRHLYIWKRDIQEKYVSYKKIVLDKICFEEAAKWHCFIIDGAIAMKTRSTLFF